MLNWFSINSRLSETQRLRSNILRVVIVSFLVITALFWVAAKAGNSDPRIDTAMLIGFVSFLVSFLFNRFGLLELAGSILSLALMGAILYFILTSPSVFGSGQIEGPLMVVPIIISGLTVGSIAPIIITIIGAGALLGGTLWLDTSMSPDAILSGLSVTLALNIAIGFFTWVFDLGFRRLLRQAIHRNRELERINQELERQRTKEQEISEQINVLAARISAAFAQQNRGANDQLVAVVQVTSAIEELNQTNEQIANASAQVARAAQEALLVAERGEDTIRNNITATGFLQSQVENTVHYMQGLSAQAEEIDQIIELITDVAEETNLLALNATIEAAGAREYGRRFAAVASEVQRLANRSRDAADQVRLVVSEVQEAIRQSTNATQEGLRDALSLTESVREIGVTIEGMVGMVQNTANLAQQISFSIQQQKSAGGQIVDTMRQISDVSQNVAYGSDELLETIFNLNQTADQLKAISTQLVNFTITDAEIEPQEQTDEEDFNPLFLTDGDSADLRDLYQDDLIKTR